MGIHGNQIFWLAILLLPMKGLSKRPAQLSRDGRKAAVVLRRKKEGPTDLSQTWDDEISSGESDSDGGRGSGDDEESVDMETPDQKRKRIARLYLASLDGDGVDVGVNDSDEEDEGMVTGGGLQTAVSKRLERDRLEAAGQLHRNVAANISGISSADILTRGLRGHQSSVTCVALTTDESFIFSGSKDNSILKWDTETGQKTAIRPTWKQQKENALSDGASFNHSSSAGEVLALAVTSDGKYVVSGGRDSNIAVFDARTNGLIKTLPGHKGAVTCMGFRRGTYSLYSGGEDRSVKVWDLNEMGYLETLFGHQDPLYSLDCWTKETPITSSADRTLRIWKIQNETHLILRGHKASIDNVSMVDDSRYVSGGQDGSLCLWKETQKKPVIYKHACHGMDEFGRCPRWICSVAALKMSDLVVSGSYDGYVRLWEANSEKKKMNEMVNIAVKGVVNDLAVSSRLIVAATGKEHKYGRWFTNKSCDNEVVVMRLPGDMTDSMLHRNRDKVDGRENEGNDDFEDEDGEDNEGGNVSGIDGASSSSSSSSSSSNNSSSSRSSSGDSGSGSEISEGE